jgi:AcrR family transcriptional regulator
MKPPAGTKGRILDAAERLFSRQGYRATSLRAVTGLAGVNLAAANYHYGSKRGLLEAVFARRLQPLNETRLARLEAVRAAARRSGRRPAVREVARAFVETSVAHGLSGAGGESFAAFIGRSFFDPDLTVQKAFTGYMAPTFESALAAFAEAMPGVPRDVLFWRLQFAIGALARVQHLTRQRGAALPGRALPAPDLARELTAFVAAGMHAPPPGRTAPRAGRARGEADRPRAPVASRRRAVVA